jgi:hypothetical protein
MIEPARDPEEAWRIMESYFDRETRILDELITDILSHERMVNDSQTLAHYSRILMAIRDAKQLGRLSDLLTEDRIKALMEIIPRKENSYWEQDQMGVRPKDMPVAFYSFVRARALELGSNTSLLRMRQDDPEEQGPTWEGPCMMGDLCGGSHAPKKCSLFMGLSPEDRLGMPPVNGYDTNVGPGEQGTRNQAESRFPPSAWFDNDRGTLAAGKGVSSAALTGGLPVEPGRFLVPVDLAASAARDGRTRGKKERLRRRRREPRLRGEQPGKETPERGRPEGNRRPEEGSGCDPRQRPKKRSDVPESGRP